MPWGRPPQRFWTARVVTPEWRTLLLAMVLRHRVQQRRLRAALIRVEVEVPTRDDALAVRRFAQARRRAQESVRFGHTARRTAFVLQSPVLSVLPPGEGHY